MNKGNNTKLDFSEKGRDLIEKYNTMHSSSVLYGTSSISQLPDMLTLIVGLYADNKINLADEFVVTDYGCGRSILSNLIAYVLDNNKDFIISSKENENSSVSEIMENLYPVIDSILREINDNPERIKAIAEAEYNGIIVQKYDPAIGEYSSLPRRKANFLMSNDVLEHIPEQDLYNVLRNIKDLGEYIYINACCRAAVNPLPGSDENPHCTLLTTDQWKEKFTRAFKVEHNYQWPCRDLTSTAMINFEPKDDLKRAYFKLFEIYKAVDLIKFPHLKEKYRREPRLTRLVSMQFRKIRTMLESNEFLKNAFDVEVPELEKETAKTVEAVSSFISEAPENKDKVFKGENFNKEDLEWVRNYFVAKELPQVELLDSMLTMLSRISSNSKDELVEFGSLDRVYANVMNTTQSNSKDSLENSDNEDRWRRQISNQDKGVVKSL